MLRMRHCKIGPGSNIIMRGQRQGLEIQDPEGQMGRFKAWGNRVSRLVLEVANRSRSRRGASRSKPLDLYCLSSWLASVVAVAVAVVVTAAGCSLLLRLPLDTMDTKCELILSVRTTIYLHCPPCLPVSIYTVSNSEDERATVPVKGSLAGSAEPQQREIYRM